MCSLRLTLTLALMTSTLASAETFIRWNQAGYAPGRAIRLVIMSETDLADQPWRIEGEGRLIQKGTLAPSVTGRGPHTALPFNHALDLPDGLDTVGTYPFSTAGQTALIRILENPYRDLLTQPLAHLRLVRSGPEAVAPRRPSHPGDARASVWIPDGDPTEGRWTPDPEGRTVDVEGGWYDAGDQLKFTLNTAYTTAHLLLAWELAPHLFPDSGGDALPEILAEARHGLNWLMKVHPSDGLFVIQVGDSRDHNQPLRLPEDDALDGERPALCTLSKVHMHAAAAALAKGAVVFDRIGRHLDAERYGNEAVRIFGRAQGAGTIRTAFYRDPTNDFYHDDSLADQLALAAVSLHGWTGDPQYLEMAIAAAPPSDTEPSWSAWHWSANFALAAADASAADRLVAQGDRHATDAVESGVPWGIPGRYVWAGLHRWTEMALAAKLATLAETGSQRRGQAVPRRLRARDGLTPLDLARSGRSDPVGRERLFEDMVDFVFGRNSWGVSFLFSPDLPNSLQNLYSPLVDLLEIFPVGAFSEGPGSAATHERLSEHFVIAEDDPFHRFNTSAGVFFDNPTDFMCQEATINGQADIMLLLTVASMVPESD